MESLSRRIRLTRLARRIEQGTDLQEDFEVYDSCGKRVSYHTAGSPTKTTQATNQQATSQEPRDYDRDFGLPDRLVDSQYGHSIIHASQTEIGEDPKKVVMEDFLHVLDTGGFDVIETEEVKERTFSSLHIEKRLGLHRVH